jgi:hypothetical protein
MAARLAGGTGARRRKSFGLDVIQAKHRIKLGDWPALVNHAQMGE